MHGETIIFTSEIRSVLLELKNIQKHTWTLPSNYLISLYSS